MTSITAEHTGSSKTASTRLLDLLAGWAAFVGSDEENGVWDAALSAEEIGELYQAAGAESLAWDGVSAEEHEEAVRAFVNERLLPLLLRGETASQRRPRAA
jgi:hypothetical protein